MPYQDGNETIAMIRRNLSTAKIIAISGSGGSLNAEGLLTALETGADEIIIKPFGAEDLLKRVATLLGGALTIESTADHLNTSGAL
jgi:DNA-binding response OmpR family regulator